MIRIQPDFYEKFACKANHCRNSCCKGWEIDIDEDTAEIYEHIEGSLGEEIRASMMFSEDGSRSFRLRGDESCPFLQEDGLCRIICRTGSDELLCDICALHPRFFQEIGAFDLTGLGLSCERVSELLVEETSPLSFTCIDEEEECVSVSFCGLLELLKVDFVDDFSFHPVTERGHLQNILDSYEKLEAIDENWTDLLKKIKTDFEKLLENLEKEDSGRGKFPDPVYDRIYQYMIYRQLEQLFVYGWKTVSAFATDGLTLIWLCQLAGWSLEEAVQRWSSEVEYSTENVEILLAEKAQTESEDRVENLATD